MYFNSQPHEEADGSSTVTIPQASYFNSQPHEEADCQIGCQYARCDISTHSLTKRLTMMVQMTIVNHLYFNSQPHEEADLTHGRKIFHKSNFNSQP